MFNSFFMECYINETGHTEKIKFKNLAFGRGGLIIIKDTGQYLCQGDKEIKVPVNYTKAKKTQFQNRDVEYDKLSSEIVNYRLKTIKKADKSSIVNNLILNSTTTLEKAKKSYKYILIALVLKIIDITESFDIDQVDLNFIINSSK